MYKDTDCMSSYVFHLFPIDSVIRSHLFAYFVCSAPDVKIYISGQPEARRGDGYLLLVYSCILYVPMQCSCIVLLYHLPPCPLCHYPVVVKHIPALLSNLLDKKNTLQYESMRVYAISRGFLNHEPET